jgi:aspartate/methionine/tyrosine aminotransferase
MAPDAVPALFHGLPELRIPRAPTVAHANEGRPAEATEPRETNRTGRCRGFMQEIAAAARTVGPAAGPQEITAAFLGPSGPSSAPLPENAESVTDLGAADQQPVPTAVKQVFDHYFRRDLYGSRIHTDPVILSSGSFDETRFGLPASLKDCLRYAVDRNWYGYSDSLGRASTRRALACLEAERHRRPATVDTAREEPRRLAAHTATAPADRAHHEIASHNVAVTLGGTAAVASLADLLAGTRDDPGTAIACVPNYPPLVAAVARRFRVHLVATPLHAGGVSVSDLVHALAVRPSPSLVLMQTVVNPWGRKVTEERIAEVVRALPARCHLILDECHDVFGPRVRLTPARRDPRVISVRSISKRWGAPGLKAGWITAHPDLIERFYAHASTTYGGPPSVLYLLMEMFAWFELARWTDSDLPHEQPYLKAEYGVGRDAWIRGVRDYLDSADRMDHLVHSARDLTLDTLDAAGIPVIVPDHSINVTAELGDLPSYHLYTRVITEANVSVFPGLLTMADSRGTVRLSPCLDERALVEGLRRLTYWHHRRGPD